MALKYELYLAKPHTSLDAWNPTFTFQLYLRLTGSTRLGNTWKNLKELFLWQTVRVKTRFWHGGQFMKIPYNSLRFLTIHDNSWRFMYSGGWHDWAGETRDAQSFRNAHLYSDSLLFCLLDYQFYDCLIEKSQTFWYWCKGSLQINKKVFSFFLPNRVGGGGR